MKALVVVALLVAAIFTGSAEVAAQPQQGLCVYRVRPFLLGDPRSRAGIGMVTASGVRCAVRWTIGGGGAVDRTVITVQPKRGRASVAGAATITYQSAPGFRGRDRFDGRICGVSTVGRACTPFVAIVMVR